MKFKKQDKDGVFKSLFAAYFVLLLHVFLLSGTGITVVLFKGVYHYLPWILGGIALLVIALFWIFYLRIKRSSTDIKDVLNHPAFQNRNVEIKLLGGVASFKIDAPVAGDSRFLLNNNGESGAAMLPMIEEGSRNIERRLSELADLYNRNLIDDEEYDMAKKRILFESDFAMDEKSPSVEVSSSIDAASVSSLSGVSSRVDAVEPSSIDAFSPEVDAGSPSSTDTTTSGTQSSTKNSQSVIKDES
ncbi:conserved hypothetical protein [Desulfamplus magnetovallimortis]|uniref:SHOCT domain-containing protein n=1 Tax=Desulfamplus magnetovallimortis TaxID=1246637 RepID=A0A1W1H5B9_9BACT|nr:SHOCT domain-containing protein [Desulfamplus magnetovallimortis]SLM27681.1 conserved hypothetical protein [Desulfamplus magnetovallimortis]